MRVQREMPRRIRRPLVRHHLRIQRHQKRRNVLLRESFRHRAVKIRVETVHVHAHRVAVFGHAKHSQNRRLALRPSLLAEHLVRLADDVIDVQLLKNCCCFNVVLEKKSKNVSYEL